MIMANSDPFFGKFNQNKKNFIWFPYRNIYKEHFP